MSAIKLIIEKLMQITLLLRAKKSSLPPFAMLVLLLIGMNEVQAAPPSWQANSAIAASTGADVTVTLPAHAANDILLLQVVVRDTNDTITWPAGWVQIATVDRGATVRYWWAWKRAASASEPNPLVDKNTANGDTYAVVTTYRGATTTGDPWEVKGTPNTATAAGHVLNGITTLTAESLIVAALCGEDNTAAAGTTYSSTNPASLTEVMYLESGTGSDGACTAGAAARTAAGATGNVTATWTATVVGSGGIVLALKPAPPTVVSINRASTDPTAPATAVAWTVVFNTSVTGVDTSDFSLVQAGGVTGATITSVTGAGTTWTVNANTGAGGGTLGLNLVDNDTIVNAFGTPLGGAGAGNGNFTGQVYSIFSCTPPANAPAGLTLSCVCDTFTRATLNPSTIFGSNWVVSTSDGTGILPSIVNSGYLRLTNNTGNNAKAATVPGIFPAAGNYISVEFKQYAYNGSGADGIAVTLSDYAIPAVPGAFGGSLGYAQRTGVVGFAGGWLGVAMDEYGNYQNPTEGRIGGPGFIVDSVGARGSGSGMSGYNWLGGTTTLAPQIDNNTSTTPSLGYTYQVIVDARNEPASTAVAVNRDTGAGYTSLINIPNVYAAATAQGFTQAPVPNNWQISFTGSTGGATNIHEIGSLRICAQTVVPPTGGTASGFSAIDESYPTAANAIPAYQNFQTGHIYMKLPGAANTFRLWVAALTGTGISSGYSTVSAKYVLVNLVDNSDNACGTDAARTCNSTCTNKAAVETNAAKIVTFTLGGPGASLSPAFTLNSSWRNLLAVMKECTTSACTAFTATTPACSADSFSVRPLSIASAISSNATNVSTTGTPIFKAGSDNFSLTATTTGIAGSPSGYTGTMEIMNTSVLAASPATVAGVVAGAFPAATSATPSSTATGATFTYSEVGAFTLAGYTPDAACTLSGVPLTAAQCNNLPRGVYDRDWTIVDGIITKNDCVQTNYSNVRDMSGTFATNTNYGKYGCYFGLLPNATVFGRFVPDHFDTVVSGGMACPSGLTCPCPSGLTCPPDPSNGFIYSGQPFTVQVTARNAAGGTTTNYNTTTGLSKAVTLSAWDALGGSTANPGGGAMTANTIPSTAFSAGVATSTSTPVYTFPAIPTIPTDIFIRAIDADSISSLRATPSASVEGGIKVVSGRIKISNAYGSELLPLPMTATVQFYNATGSWAPSTSDTATSIAAANFALSFPVATLVACETALTVTGSSPNFKLNLSAPGSGNNGWTDLTLNMGAVASGNRCTAVGGPGAAATTANRPWLQYPAGTNPTARATFGVYKGSNDFIYQREAY